MLGVFGSAFNPPTRGHEYVIRQALGLFDRVVVVPSYDHAFGKWMAPFDVRLALTEAFVRDLDDPRVFVSDIERDIWESRAVSSLDLLWALSERYYDEQPVMIIGPDNAKRLSEFSNFDALSAAFPIYMVPGRADHFPRSTEVRRRICTMKPYDDAVTPSVAHLLKTDAIHFVEPFSGL